MLAVCLGLTEMPLAWKIFDNPAITTDQTRKTKLDLIKRRSLGLCVTKDVAEAIYKIILSSVTHM